MEAFKQTLLNTTSDELRQARALVAHAKGLLNNLAGPDYDGAVLMIVEGHLEAIGVYAEDNCETPEEAQFIGEKLSEILTEFKAYYEKNWGG